MIKPDRHLRMRSLTAADEEKGLTDFDFLRAGRIHLASIITLTQRVGSDGLSTVDESSSDNNLVHSPLAALGM